MSATRLRWAIAALSLAVAAGAGFAQELEPRAYRTLPVGINFLIASYSVSDGNVLADPTIPIEDLKLRTSTVVLGYARSVPIFGRSGLVSLIVPHTFIAGSATVDGEFVSGTREGFADARAKFSVNLIGGPAVRPADFARYRQRGNLGVSLTVSAPVGQYDDTKLVNIGANRWGAKLETGFSAVRGRWILDVAAGVWFFTANNDFLGGQTRKQDPIGSLQAHVSYDFRNGIWLALDANYFAGGRSSVDGIENDDLQQNSRWGVTLSIPLGRAHALQLSAHSGAFTRVGADFKVATLGYRFRWFDSRRSG